MTAASAELIAAVERSPQAAAAHDRAGWVGLFTADARIEDPVGSRPHIGREQIGRFYDTFIAPRQITFHRDFDVVQDHTVVRDVTLEVVMASGLTMNIPAFLRYDLRAEGGEWKMAALRAYWELPAMVAVMLRQGVKSVPTSLQLSASLLRHQGLRGTTGFLSGFRGVGTRGKRRVEEFLAADARVKGWSKLIAAGDTVVASVTTESGRGVMFCEIGSAPAEISVGYFG